MQARIGNFSFKLTRLRVSIGVFLLIYLAHVLQPLYWRRPGADDCTFGPVTNEEYREMRSAARRELLFDRFWLPWDKKKQAKRIAEAIEIVSNGSASFYVRMAAMHAAMKSLNGEHLISSSIRRRSRNINSGLPLGKNYSVTPFVSYRYEYDPILYKLIPYSILTPFSATYSAAISPVFLKNNNIDIEYHSPYGRYINHQFDIVTGYSIMDWIITYRIRFFREDRPGFGPCPVLPLPNDLKQIIQQHEFTNVRP